MYWLVSFAPSFVQSIALCIVISTLLLFLARLKLLKKVLKKEKLSNQMFNPVIPRIDRLDFKNPTFFDYTLPKFPVVFDSFQDLLDLGRLLEKIFGPILLAAISSIFVVTTVQIYYCYVLIASSQKESQGYSIWTLIVAINEIFWNVLVIVYLTTLCEMITSQVRKNAVLYKNPFFSQNGKTIKLVEF